MMLGEQETIIKCNPKEKTLFSKIPNTVNFWGLVLNSFAANGQNRCFLMHGEQEHEIGIMFFSNFEGESDFYQKLQIP